MAESRCWPKNSRPLTPPPIQNSVSAAQSLLALIKAFPQGENHIQFAQGTSIAQANRGTAIVNMHAPPTEDD